MDKQPEKSKKRKRFEYEESCTSETLGKNEEAYLKEQHK